MYHKSESSGLAKERLKVLFVSEKIACTAEDMEQMKREIKRVIHKYIDTTEKHIEIRIRDTKE
ncbi:MAG: cell division topological specificity factor MinE [Lachnospiraceae bacterium]